MKNSREILTSVLKTTQMGQILSLIHICRCRRPAKNSQDKMVLTILSRNSMIGGISMELRAVSYTHLSASSHLTVQDGWQDARGMTVDNTVNLVNWDETLPQTGDVIAVVFVVAGSILIGAICALILELIFRTAKRRIRR